MNHVICGSKLYHNISFDNLVDSFDIIWRHNFLISDQGYGKKTSSYQVLNCHIYDKYKKKTNKKKLYQNYNKSKGICSNVSSLWYDYIHDHINTSQIKYFPDNNTALLRTILLNNNIPLRIQKQIRCGMGSIAQCIKNSNKPFIIGFDLIYNDNFNNCMYTDNRKVSSCHCKKTEIYILKELHNRNLIDLTFCLIEDKDSLELNCSKISPTAVALKILLKIYGSVKLNNIEKSFVDIIKEDFSYEILDNSIILR